MINKYNPLEIEPKWQRIWNSDQRYKASDDSDKPKYYITNMFPYPSGAGMHVGHIFEYAIIDTYTRFRRMQGDNVMYPMGFDNFGLPAENYAIKTGVPPQESIATNVKRFKHQLDRIGISIDWSREIQTSDTSYYKWTQWIFTKLYERGLAYQKESFQWWCPVDKTVLANEQVEDNACWRCGSKVVKKSMKQWFFRITEYADALLDGLEDLNWPDKIKIAQRNWIGRSNGAELKFKVANSEECISVFSSRPETIFGATFIVLAPEHPIAQALATGSNSEPTHNYIDEAIKKTDIERLNDSKEKTGVFTGNYAVNPANGSKIPIWIADYVLGDYGTGAIMAVPAHDVRDYAFASKYNLQVTEVVRSPGETIENEQYTGEGILINSDKFDGMSSSDARKEIVEWLEQLGLGGSKVTYKMRDWLISRQRYWGAPIPIAYDKDGNAHPIPEGQLPVLLPEVEDYTPDGSGKGVLARNEEFRTVVINGEEMTRETDTMDGYACSSWYLLRYVDPSNTKQAWDRNKANYWSPVDMYVGGDHAVAHLLYVRFWHHVFYDMGLVPTREPVKQLAYHGLIQAEDGRKMSKSLGNTVDPLELIDEGHGADALRTYELFLGPITENSNWSSSGIAGVDRFLNRVWSLTQEYMAASKIAGKGNSDLQTLTHRTIKKVTDNFNRLSFNTAVAALMEYVNELYKLKKEDFSEEWQDSIETLVRLIQPSAPHMAAELWQQLGHDSQLDFVSWPEWDESLLISSTISLVIQINGKVRAHINIDNSAGKDEIIALALAQDNVRKYVGDEMPSRVVYVPGRLISIAL